MKKKGFTLIELLAVIVILAIIALIATPIILNIINDSREESNKRSVELYGKAVEQAIAKSQLNGTEIPAGDLSSSLLSTVEYSGNAVTCKTNKQYEDGGIYLEGCTVGSDTKEYKYGVRQYAYMWFTDTGVNGPSIEGDASSLSTSAPTDKNKYLKFKLDRDNKVKESYACVLYGDSRKETCVRGGSADFYTENLSILKGLESEGFRCYFDEGFTTCIVGSVDLRANSRGEVYISDGVDFCYVYDFGGSSCDC